MSKNPARFYELDLLRFIAAMAVVLFHYLFRGQQGGFIPVTFSLFENAAQYGYLGVNLFFMISGFVISLSAANRSPVQFAISRVARLYPAFWAGVSITAVMIIIMGDKLFQVGLSQYFVNLTMLAQFVGVDDIDGVYWTLYVELKFYAVIFLVLLFNKFHKIELVLAGWLMVLLFSLLTPLHTIINTLVFPEWAPYFISGVVFYLLKEKGFSLFRSAILLIAFLLSLQTAANAMAEFNVAYSMYASPLVAVLVVMLFYVVFTLILFDKLSWFRSHWAIKIGALTYPLYLIHQNIGFMLFTYFNEAINKYILLALIVFIMLALSWLIHVMVEKKLGPSLKKTLEKYIQSNPQLKTDKIIH